MIIMRRDCGRLRLGSYLMIGVRYAGEVPVG